MGKSKNISILKRRSNREGTKPPTYDGDESPLDSEHVRANSQSRRDRINDEKRAKSDAGAYLWSNLRGKLFTPRFLEDEGHLMNSFTILKVILNQDCQLFVFRTHV
jgi:hypothetical protein